MSIPNVLLIPKVLVELELLSWLCFNEDIRHALSQKKAISIHIIQEYF